MKTYTRLFEKVCNFQNLHKAYLKARRGKNGIGEVARFTYHLEGELLKLQRELLSGTYRQGDYRNFVIHEPKRRLISAVPFRDRVVHHAICNIIEPIFEKRFIYDSYACRRGKGTHNGVERLQSFIRRFPESYALQCDVRKYFPSVDHGVLKSIIRKKIADEKLLGLLDLVIDSPEGEKGIPIGNLTSQLFANIYLNELDYFAKHALRAKFYVRYMDDFVILHPSKTCLHETKARVETFLLGTLRLNLHPTKATVSPVRVGMDFLGYRIFVNHRLARKGTVKKFLRRSRHAIQLYQLGKIEFDKLAESFNSWEAYLSHADTHALKQSLYGRYFKNVF